MTQKKANKFLRFSQMGVVMGVIIGGFTWFGTWMDGQYPNEKDLWTVCFSLGGVLIAMYYMIKDILRITKQDEEQN